MQKNWFHFNGIAFNFSRAVQITSNLLTDTHFTISVLQVLQHFTSELDHKTQNNVNSNGDNKHTLKNRLYFPLILFIPPGTPSHYLRGDEIFKTRSRSLTVTIVWLPYHSYKFLFVESNCCYRPKYSHDLFQIKRNKKRDR